MDTPVQGAGTSVQWTTMSDEQQRPEDRADDSDRGGARPGPRWHVGTERV